MEIIAEIKSIAAGECNTRFCRLDRFTLSSGVTMAEVRRDDAVAEMFRNTISGMLKKVLIRQVITKPNKTRGMGKLII
ncbi:MAG: hypothetical protein H0Z35_05770 [Thermoanaerobacteraceae bacterium]|nr:hypothetical protein [Thermoanaerobacteraceae bacterium]